MSRKVPIFNTQFKVQDREYRKSDLRKAWKIILQSLFLGAAMTTVLYYLPL